MTEEQQKENLRYSKKALTAKTLLDEEAGLQDNLSNKFRYKQSRRKVKTGLQENTVLAISQVFTCIEDGDYTAMREHAGLFDQQESRERLISIVSTVRNHGHSDVKALMAFWLVKTNTLSLIRDELDDEMQMHVEKTLALPALEKKELYDLLGTRRQLKKTEDTLRTLIKGME